MRLLFAFFAALPLVACTVRTVETTVDESPSPTMPDAPPPPPATVARPEAAPSNDARFDEVVDVRMRDTTRGQWFCTGTLVSSTRVVTAAHCLDTSMFVSFEIVTQAGVHVAARSPAVVSAAVEDVANPDIGVLTLTEPVVLARYATLTDVSARVEAGDAVQAAAFVRAAERPGTPFGWSDTMPVSSTVPFGYAHGFGTPMFSKGGDSGAGLFLVVDGKPTHQLVGVARQPEPARGIDHFSRIDASFLAWLTSE